MLLLLFMGVAVVMEANMRRPAAGLVVVAAQVDIVDLAARPRKAVLAAVLAVARRLREQVDIMVLVVV
jgi:hypothetical protein